MSWKNIKFSLVFVLLVFVPVLSAAQTSDSIDAASSVDVSEPSTEGWLVITGSIINFYYLPDANLRKLEARLRTRSVPMSQGFRMLLSNRYLTTEEKIAARLQIILLRVKNILGMDPLNMHIKMQVFKTRHDLDWAYEQMFHSPTNFKSFYMHHFESIFSNEQDFIDSVIAHELGHAVIDHYFAVAPPSQMAELMATYVDAHLDEY